MKVFSLIILITLSLVAPFSTAKTENECITEFTHSYFSWLKNIVRNSNNGTFEEYMSAEKAKYEELLTFINEFDTETCSEHNKTQITDLYNETLKMRDLHKQLYLEAKRGSVKVMNKKTRETRTKYKMYSSKFVKDLRRQTGIQW
ncbi:hypothetical protein [Alteromonas sp. a30]|uniref:hypothetical protein n=1 Tax=Alteromonas sp. a30 TaxID=2730917 RepID=UPI0022817549|nr:hypothetical protein [Alteromonas sp. a30]MCY7293814.1 hypothetical protein [Alteromonas sp. a30]